MPRAKPRAKTTQQRKPAGRSVRTLDDVLEAIWHYLPEGYAFHVGRELSRREWGTRETYRCYVALHIGHPNYAEDMGESFSAPTAADLYRAFLARLPQLDGRPRKPNAAPSSELIVRPVRATVIDTPAQPAGIAQQQRLGHAPRGLPFVPGSE